MKNTSNIKNEKPKGTGLILISITIILLVLIFWLAYIFRGQENFKVLKIYGEGDITNASKYYGLVEYPASKKNFGAIVAEKEDILLFNDYKLFYDQIKEDSLIIDASSKAMIYLNCKIHTLILNSNRELLPWFNQMKDSEIADLKTLHFESDIPKEYIPYLTKIASQNPNLNLVFENNEEENTLYKYLLNTFEFQPDFVYTQINESQLELLYNFKSAKCLFLDLTDSIVKRSLPKLEAMNQCIINGDQLQSISPLFFENNKQIGKLSIIAPIRDLSAIEPLDQLSQLNIINQSVGTDLKPINNKLTNLSVLNLTGKFEGVDLIAACKKLRWLGFPYNTTQQEFDSIIRHCKELQIVEVKQNEKLKNMTSLKQLPNLKALVITGKQLDMKPLHELQSLRYLSVGEENLTDSTAIRKLKKSLPGTIIVPNSGACMGSGWLLLLLPLTIIFILLIKNKHSH